MNCRPSAISYQPTAEGAHCLPYSALGNRTDRSNSTNPSDSVEGSQTRDAAPCQLNPENQDETAALLEYLKPRAAVLVPARAS